MSFQNFHIRCAEFTSINDVFLIARLAHSTRNESSWVPSHMCFPISGTSGFHFKPMNKDKTAPIKNNCVYPITLEKHQKHLHVSKEYLHVGVMQTTGGVHVDPDGVH